MSFYEILDLVLRAIQIVIDIARHLLHRRKTEKE